MTSFCRPILEQSAAFADGKVDIIKGWCSIKESSITQAGQGLFAARDFTPGEIVGYYLGKVITSEEADRKQRAYGQTPHFARVVYMQTQQNDDPTQCYVQKDIPSIEKYMRIPLEQAHYPHVWVIDGYEWGSYVKYVNSCWATPQSPNVCFGTPTKEGYTPILVTQHVPKGQEFLVMYSHITDVRNNILVLDPAWGRKRGIPTNLPHDVTIVMEDHLDTGIIRKNRKGQFMRPPTKRWELAWDHRPFINMVRMDDYPPVEREIKTLVVGEWNPQEERYEHVKSYPNSQIYVDHKKAVRFLHIPGRCWAEQGWYGLHINPEKGKLHTWDFIPFAAVNIRHEENVQDQGIPWETSSSSESTDYHDPGVSSYSVHAPDIQWRIAHYHRPGVFHDNAWHPFVHGSQLHIGEQRTPLPMLTVINNQGFILEAQQNQKQEPLSKKNGGDHSVPKQARVTDRKLWHNISEQELNELNTRAPVLVQSADPTQRTSGAQQRPKKSNKIYLEAPPHIRKELMESTGPIRVKGIPTKDKTQEWKIYGSYPVTTYTSCKKTRSFAPNVVLLLPQRIRRNDILVKAFHVTWESDVFLGDYVPDGSMENQRLTDRVKFSVGHRPPGLCVKEGHSFLSSHKYNLIRMDVFQKDQRWDFVQRLYFCFSLAQYSNATHHYSSASPPGRNDDTVG